jgi:hypothetical protein
MDNKKGTSFFLAFIAILLGRILLKHFSFKTFSFKEPILDILYLVVFVIAIYLIIKNRKVKAEK